MKASPSKRKSIPLAGQPRQKKRHKDACQDDANDPADNLVAIVDGHIVMSPQKLVRQVDAIGEVHQLPHVGKGGTVAWTTKRVVNDTCKTVEKKALESFRSEIDRRFIEAKACKQKFVELNKRALDQDGGLSKEEAADRLWQAECYRNHMRMIKEMQGRKEPLTATGHITTVVQNFQVPLGQPVSFGEGRTFMFTKLPLASPPISLMDALVQEEEQKQAVPLTVELKDMGAFPWHAAVNTVWFISRHGDVWRLDLGTLEIRQFPVMFADERVPRWGKGYNSTSSPTSVARLPLSPSLSIFQVNPETGKGKDQRVELLLGDGLEQKGLARVAFGNNKWYAMVGAKSETHDGFLLGTIDTIAARCKPDVWLERNHTINPQRFVVFGDCCLAFAKVPIATIYCWRITDGKWLDVTVASDDVASLINKPWDYEIIKIGGKMFLVVAQEGLGIAAAAVSCDDTGCTIGTVTSLSIQGLRIEDPCSLLSARNNLLVVSDYRGRVWLVDVASDDSNTLKLKTRTVIDMPRNDPHQTIELTHMIGSA